MDTFSHTILILIMWFMLGFGIVMSVSAILTVPFYLIIKHGKNNVSMYAVFAVVDAVLLVITSIIFITIYFESDIGAMLSTLFALMLIPPMIVCLIGAVIIDRIEENKKRKYEEDE